MPVRIFIGEFDFTDGSKNGNAIKLLWFSYLFKSHLTKSIYKIMKNILLVALIVSMATMLSCRKKENKNDEKTGNYVPKGYIQLNVGNYWVYQHYRVMSNGSDSITSMIDSVFISGTIDYNGKTFYKVENNKWIPQLIYLRDSVGNLIDTTGDIIMSENNFTDSIYTETTMAGTSILFHIATRMYDDNTTIVTPIDSFNHCIERRDYIKVYYQNPIPKAITDEQYYAKGVGLVEGSYTYIGVNQKFIRKLKNYRIIH